MTGGHVALWAAALCVAVSATEKPPRRHIFLIVADDLGWNDVDFHGSQQIPTPTLSRLADDGVQLNNYYVQPVCSPTRATLLTGRHVIHSGIYDPDCGVGTTNSVPFNFSMLPVPLSKVNYESHAVGKWHLGMFSDRVVPTGKGFASFHGYYSGAEDYYTHDAKGAHDMHRDFGSNLSPDFSLKGNYSTFVYTSRAQQIIKEFAAKHNNNDNDDTSLFMYLAYQAIHSPDEVPSSYMKPFRRTIPNTPNGVGRHRRTVAGMVACLDEGIGNVTTTLQQVGMLNDSLIIFTTDNGGPAQGFNQNMASNWPLRGMKRTLWEGGVRAVGFVYGDGLQQTGYVSNGLMHAADWYPTILTAALEGKQKAKHGREDESGDSTEFSYPYADWRELMDGSVDPPFILGDGVNVWGMLSSGEASPRDEVLLEAHPAGQKDDGNGQAIIVGDLKLILEKGPMWHGPPNDLWYASGSNPSLYNHTVDCGSPAPKSGPLPPCMFNLTADPCEFNNIINDQPDDYARLLDRLKVYQKTAVPKSFHTLPLCDNPSSPLDKPVDGTWMPVCP
jgi:arylsulfatase A-like enzyme